MLSLAVPASSWGATVTEKVDVDTYVRSDFATSAFDTSGDLDADGFVDNTKLYIDGSPVRRSLLRFNAVPASPNGITSAKLRIYVEYNTTQGYDVRAASCSWSPATTYSTAPAQGALLASTSNDPTGWTEIALRTSAVPAGGGDVCFEVSKSGDWWGYFQGLEASGTNEAQLVFDQATAPQPPPPPSSGADLYVSPNGSGTSSCTQTAPCTVSRANSIVTAGQTVQVADGTYGSATLSKGGTSTAHVRWVGASRWGAHFPTVHLTGWYIDFGAVGRGFDVGNASSSLLIWADGSYDRIIGNHAHQANVGCVSGGAVEATGWQSGDYNGVHIDILNNLVEDAGTGGPCSQMHGIYIASAYSLVANNIVRRTIGYGIHLWHNAKYTTIVNNTITNTQRSGIVVGAGDTTSANATGNYVANNVATSNTEYAITECCSSSPHGSNTYVNNLGWANGSSTVVNQNWGTASISGSLYQNPLYVSSTDLHLQAGSPARDSGSAVHAPGDDFDGTARPQGTGVDRGAYEQ
jgi:parallel beta-helix repeat protein